MLALREYCKVLCVYYGDLTSDQRKKYDNEAAELVANNAWDKKVYEGTLH
ncbi:hypothetical protein DFH29DRAFT_1008611 [Suillus ampliporus]|nr:hypothetical protein DFH29DRAFT_1008611 [Suillus ampliporus]